MPYSKVPSDILEQMKEPMDPALALHTDDRNDLLNPGYLPREVGYCQIPVWKRTYRFSDTNARRHIGTDRMAVCMARS